MPFCYRFLWLSSICAVALSGCGGGGGTTPTPTPPSVSGVTVSGAGAPAVGDTVQLTATATFSDGTTQTVTAQATWESSNQAIVTVTSGGLASFVAQGEADVKATYRSVSGTSHVTVAAKAAARFTLAGVVTDATNGNPLPNVNVRIADGADAGKATATDTNGRYSMTGIAAGSFVVQFSRSDYETRSVSVSLGADTTVDVKIAAQTNVTRFYGTYNTALSVLQQTCEFSFSVGPTGTFKIEGSSNGASMTVTIVERGTTRTYKGSIGADGSFSGSGGGVIAGFSPPKNEHDYGGSLTGTTTGSKLDATETINFTNPCPGKSMKIGYSGSK